ncbi:MAG: GNAT family N-acetyltransferase [Gammaproteobacteria bacterium]
MIVAACDPEHADARVLVEELSATLAGITGDSGKSSFDPADVRGERARFVVARAPDGALLGCGALRPLDGKVAELKRMFARPGTRGVGEALLTHLEEEARRLAYGALWLETRRVNTRAVAFYLKHGYREIAPFGRYIGRPEAICLGKAIA